MKNFIKKYKHAWILAYFFIYLPWFLYLEKAVTDTYTSVHIKLDDYIPFNEWFVIPYYIWFGFIAVTVCYLLFKDKKEFYRCCAFLFTGMTICLAIYTIWPNGQDLRIDLNSLGRSNIMIDIVRNLYATDTPTNVCPSIHVFNSLGACVAIFHTKKLRSKKYITVPTVILTVLISLSTVFLKQHSCFDVIAACLLAAVLYLIIYVPNYEKIREARQEQAKTI